MSLHADATLSPLGRQPLCERIRLEGWKVAEAAFAANVRAHRLPLARPLRQTVNHLYRRLFAAFNPPQTLTRHAIVVPQSLVSRCLEVPAEVRTRLGIDLYGLYETGHVNRISPSS